jgi:hypothetical protein
MYYPHEYLKVISKSDIYFAGQKSFDHKVYSVGIRIGRCHVTVAIAMRVLQKRGRIKLKSK